MSMLQRTKAFLVDDKGGERDTMTTLLIFALVVIPLIALLLIFSEEIEAFATDTLADLFS